MFLSAALLSGCASFADRVASYGNYNPANKAWYVATFYFCESDLELLVALLAKQEVVISDDGSLGIFSEKYLSVPNKDYPIKVLYKGSPEICEVRASHSELYRGKKYFLIWFGTLKDEIGYCIERMNEELERVRP